MQGERAAEGGVGGLRLEWIVGQQPVDRTNISTMVQRALQEQAQGPHSLQGYLGEANSKISLNSGILEKMLRLKVIFVDVKGHRLVYLQKTW